MKRNPTKISAKSRKVKQPHSQQESDLMFRLGARAAERWLIARVAMPAGSTIGDYRRTCEAQFLRDMDRRTRGLIGSYLEGFNDEVAGRALDNDPDFHDAHEVLSREARMYQEQADEAAECARAARKAAIAARDRAASACAAARALDSYFA